MSWQLVSLEATAPQPWRNGGGVTRELLAWPDAADWRVRMSVADVQSDGPFSRFEGVERWFAVLAGEGVILRIDAEEHRLASASEPLRFDGAAAVHCRLTAGATRDFNLMAPPGRAQLRRVRGRTHMNLQAQRLLALYAHDVPATVVTEGEATDVPAYHLAWRLAGTSTQCIVETDNALWMEVSR
ncbi:HutD family protein [Ramlibacter sp. PS3R-8]|uniref:HutD/Ves family protein n=1 Tax=Ramlibacter sp. PS3R-8 TaxID=3133437 RepID=UPI0030B7B838